MELGLGRGFSIHTAGSAYATLLGMTPTFYFSFRNGFIIGIFWVFVPLEFVAIARL